MDGFVLYSVALVCAGFIVGWLRGASAGSRGGKYE